MKNTKFWVIFSVILMSISGVLLFSAVLYYDFSDKVVNYNYSDVEEYNDITQGLKFLSKLPIHFNIVNKYFSDFDNLAQSEKEEIVMGYVIKNRYGLYSCGPSTLNKEYLCIDKEVINNSEILSVFGSDFQFENDEIKLYLDDFGASSVKGVDGLSYRVVLNNEYNNSYRLYSEFSKYRKVDDVYVFYLYQGYYNGNCVKGEELILYDFMTGDEIYMDKCNGNNDFEVAPGEKIKHLQLYKYELKKDENDKFYLHGYNPVNDYE